jgi:hypothetical protein
MIIKKEVLQLEDNYRDIGLNSYGNKCEICGFSLVEVHHVDYNKHTYYENTLRKMVKQKQDITQFLEEAKRNGFLFWDGHDLSKDSRSTNLSVLCPNHHTMTHTADLGLALLKLIPERK